MQPIFLGEVIDKLPTATSFSQVQTQFIYLIIFIALQFIGEGFGGFISNWGEQAALRDLRTRLFVGFSTFSFSPLLFSRRDGHRTSGAAVTQDYARIDRIELIEVQTRIIADPVLVIVSVPSVHVR
jgi:ABC-type multidrug transport system fused ATPase/permease subunit